MQVTISGSGPDLVLVHGWGMNAQVWDEIATYLAGQFRVHCVDLTGYGRSVAIDPYTLDALVDGVAAACPPRATVCGWSLGGQVALRWAVRHPGQIERLVLIATTPRFVRAPGWENGMEPAVFDAFARAVANDTHEALLRFIQLQAQGDTAARKVTRLLRACLAAQAAPAVAALTAGLQILKNADLRADLPGIAQPVLIVHGEHDTLVHAGAAEYLQRMLPRATLETIAGVAHAPFVTRPQAMARRIAEFCHG